MTGLVRAAGLILAISLLTVACDSGSRGNLQLRVPVPTPTGSDTLVVGLVGTMSGPGSWMGQDAYEGADFGVHTLNKEAGEETGTPTFELVTLDDRGDPARARELIERVASSDQTIGLVYAGPSSALDASESVLARAGIPAVASFGDYSNSGHAHIFQTSPTYRVQAKRLLAYASGDRGYLNAGMLVDKSTDGTQAATAVQEANAIYGLPLTKARYDTGQTDLSTPLNRLRRHHVETVIVGGGPAALSAAQAALRNMGALYRTTTEARIAGARPRVARRRLRSGWWHPQVLALAPAAGPLTTNPVPGTIASDSYDRGGFYLPLPSFESYRRAYRQWWGAASYGWQLRSFEAARLVGWAQQHATGSDDLAQILEGVKGRRVGGTEITFGPGDHVAPDPDTIGLWVVPRDGIRVPERGLLPASFPWVPLARGFARGRRTRIPLADARWLFPQSSVPGRRPSYRSELYGVVTSAADPVH